MSAQPTQSPQSHRKRKSVSLGQQTNNMADTSAGAEAQNAAAPVQADQVDTSAQEPKIKKSRTNTPWTPAEELRLKQMRDVGNSWSEIAKVSNILLLITKRMVGYVLPILIEHCRLSRNGQKAVLKNTGTRSVQYLM